MKNTLDHIQQTTENNKTTEKNIIAGEKVKEVEEEGGGKTGHIYRYVKFYGWLPGLGRYDIVHVITRLLLNYN